MKLMPASNAASTQSRARSRSTPPEYVSHEPRLISDTSMSLLPSLRRFILESTLASEHMAAIDPNLHIASVQLDVGDLPRSVDFYERVLGLPVISRDEHGAELGPDPERPALVLRGIVAPTPLQPRATGLYHVAWLHPSRAALAETVRRIAGARWPLDGASDHGVSEALYLSDPDGLGIEIYVDRPRALWNRPPDGHGVERVTLPLDLDSLLAEGAPVASAAMPADTAIG